MFLEPEAVSYVQAWHGSRNAILILFSPVLLGAWVWVGASSIPSPALISHFHKADSSQPREKWIKWRSSWKARGRGGEERQTDKECGEVLVNVGEGR